MVVASRRTYSLEMDLILILVILAALGAVAAAASRRNNQRELARREDELAPEVAAEVRAGEVGRA